MLPTSKACSRCGREKSISQFYTKGLRHDATCKECIKSKKRAKCYRGRLSPEMERLLEVKKIVEAWELERLEIVHARIKEIIERCENRLREQKASPGGLE